MWMSPGVSGRLVTRLGAPRLRQCVAALLPVSDALAGHDPHHQHVNCCADSHRRQQRDQCAVVEGGGQVGAARTRGPRSVCIATTSSMTLGSGTTPGGETTRGPDSTSPYPIAQTRAAAMPSRHPVSTVAVRATAIGVLTSGKRTAYHASNPISFAAATSVVSMSSSVALSDLLPPRDFLLSATADPLPLSLIGLSANVIGRS